MIDLHSHILPGLDDGARDLQEAVQMASLAAQSGVKAVVATPHCVYGDAQMVAEAFTLLQQALKRERIPVALFMGMEIYGTWETAELLLTGELATLNGSRYPLIEFAFESDGEEETGILGMLLKSGYRPVVAHPERYAYVQRDPERINLWQEMGCLFQVNRGSLLGRFGSSAQSMALALVDRGFASVIASDAHSAVMRTPWMADAKQLLLENFHPSAFKALLQENPLRIIKNEPMPKITPDWF